MKGWRDEGEGNKEGEKGRGKMKREGRGRVKGVKGGGRGKEAEG